jgi:SAM-dependent methyltransferase
MSEIRRLNVGCGRDIKPGWINLDIAKAAGVDITADLEKCATTPLPLDADCIDEFLLSHVMEHVTAVLPLMQELHRVAKPNAVAVIRAPYGGSDDAWEDPTHVRAYFANSFAYFSQPSYWRADYGYRGDWQTKKIVFTVKRTRLGEMTPQAFHDLIHTQRNVVQEIIAEMIAIKPIREQRKELQVSPSREIRLLD